MVIPNKILNDLESISIIRYNNSIQREAYKSFMTQLLAITLRGTRYSFTSLLNANATSYRPNLRYDSNMWHRRMQIIRTASLCPQT